MEVGEGEAEHGQGVPHCGVPGDYEGLVHRVSHYVGVIDLHQPPCLAAKDELAVLPWVAGDQVHQQGIVLHPDSLDCLVDC